MNTLTYKKFIGTFNYIEKEDVLYGKIEGINDFITFEGESIKEIKKAFHEAVDDYIESCQIHGKDPLKSFKGVFNVRVSSELHREASLEATRRDINLNQLVVKALKNELERRI